jgi:hypothetical protein
MARLSLVWTRVRPSSALQQTSNWQQPGEAVALEVLQCNRCHPFSKRRARYQQPFRLNAKNIPSKKLLIAPDVEIYPDIAWMSGPLANSWAMPWDTTALPARWNGVRTNGSAS